MILHPHEAVIEIADNGFIFTDDKSRLHLYEVCGLLRQSHWAKDRPIEVIARTIETSLCVMVYHKGRQIGFARVVTDYAVYSLILDVIVDEQYRGHGLGKKLITFINTHPRLKDTAKVLWTKYAKQLYEQCGFQEEECYTFMFNRP